MARRVPVVHAAQQALRLPCAERSAPLTVLAADWSLFEAIDQQIQHATDILTALLPDTPAGVLLDIPGVGVLTASSYGAAIGDPNRYRDAAAAYRASGLVPVTYESAVVADRAPASAEKDPLSCAGPSPDFGRGLGLHHPDFITYRRQLLSRGKPPLVAMIVVGHRAHRLAFAMLRSQKPYDANRWSDAVAGRRHPTDEQGPSRRHHGRRSTSTT